jgi:hypothetical protein
MTMKKAPTNLDELLKALDKYYSPDDIYYKYDVWEREDHMATPPWHGAPMKNGELDMTSLPTFGTSLSYLSRTEGVWSWDETRMLIGDAGYNFEIIDRTKKEEGR